LRRTTSFDVLSVKVCAGVLAVGDWKNQKQESLAIAKTTAQCAQYMGALKTFGSPRKRPRLLFPKFVKAFCSDRYWECVYKIWSS